MVRFAQLRFASTRIDQQLSRLFGTTMQWCQIRLAGRLTDPGQQGSVHADPRRRDSEGPAHSGQSIFETSARSVLAQAAADLRECPRRILARALEQPIDPALQPDP